MKRVAYALAVVGAITGLLLFLSLFAKTRGMSSFSVSTSEDVEARAAFDAWISKLGFRKSSTSDDETRYEGPVTLLLQKGNCTLEWSASAWAGKARAAEVDALRTRIRAWWEAYPRR